MASITASLSSAILLKPFQCNHQLHKPSNWMLVVSPQDYPCVRCSTPIHPRRAFRPSALALSDSEDLVEKDWSFLDELDVSNADRIISAGAIKDTSRILISTASEGFVDRVMETTKSGEVLVAHKSLFVLAGIKEKYDDGVKCWQGKLTRVPTNWAPLDVLFLYFLPALEDDLDAVLGALSNICSPGARVVVSHPQGRGALREQRSKFDDVITADLPEEGTLRSVADAHRFDVTDFVDEDGFFLAVLSFSGSGK